ncbi:Sec-independent protein translocase protein TatB [Novosphingobium terrae]|uniref:Sec-independent protein translocase protein TatB n=1 Tax=Novosphingobium terrae TaxID=2726189 RepID=UPI0019805CBE|nr:Sec-independent protein translocase protein TatB [Novosphingobium terrae]
MFLDIDPSEFLLTAVVAVVVIGPKDLPRAMRAAGKWMAKMRRISGHFRSGIETMIREAELEDMEKKWREQNEAIMKAQAPVAALPSEVTAHAPTEPLSVGEVGHEGHGAAHNDVAPSAVPATDVAHHQAPHGEAKSPSQPEILS